MLAFNVDIRWERDSKGYRILPAELSPPKPEESVVMPPGPMIVPAKPAGASEGLPLRIVGKGGSPVRYSPLKERDLYFKYSQLESAADLLKFMHRYGRLTNPEPDYLLGRPYEDVDECLRSAREMRALLSRKDAAPLPAGRLSRVDVLLATDPKTRLPRIVLKPPSLRAALWLQFGQSVVGGPTWRACQYCQKMFKAGVGSKPYRRLDSKFCSTDCQITSNNKARSASRAQKEA